jgi:plastocyanin
MYRIVSLMKPNAALLVALLIVSAGMLVAGCTAPGGDGTQPTPTETVTTPTETQTPAATETASVTTVATTAAGGGIATVELAADNMAFDASTITVPAGVEVTIIFDNQDDGILHNVAVYTDSSAAEEIYVGETITGPSVITYTFTAPEEPGTYFFRCDVHPQQMTGDFIVE